MEHKNLFLRKLEAGGHEVLDGDGNSLGVIEHKHLMDHVRSYTEGFNPLSSVRLGDHTLPVDREVINRAKRTMEETGASVGHATRLVLRSDETLRRKYERAHGVREELSESSSAGGAFSESSSSGRVMTRGYRRVLGVE